jgi:DNA-directed RNA polymerase subunit RPC12/RpoP
MGALATCPTCRTEFEATTNRNYRGLLHEMFVSEYTSPEERIRKSSGVRCPHCGTEFPSNTVRFFGFLSPIGMRNLFLIVVLAVLASWIYFGFFFERR